MPHVAVVFVSYRLPESRLREHFEWNGDIYEAYGDQLRVYVVSDVGNMFLPNYAETVIVSEDRLPVLNGRPVFSLSLTKNAGILKAIEDGADIIVSTDADIAFDFDGLGMMVAVDSKSAVIPVYRMAESYEDRAVGRSDPGCTGTISMTPSNWQRIPYEEKCFGYGAEDGILLRDIEREGLRVIRRYADGSDCTVSHIAHELGDGARVPGSGSDTCWNRADGFNPDRFTVNRLLHDGRVRQQGQERRQRARHVRRNPK